MGAIKILMKFSQFLIFFDASYGPRRLHRLPDVLAGAHLASTEDVWARVRWKQVCLALGRAPRRGGLGAEGFTRIWPLFTRLMGLDAYTVYATAYLMPTWRAAGMCGHASGRIKCVLS